MAKNLEVLLVDQRNKFVSDFINRQRRLRSVLPTNHKANLGIRYIFYLVAILVHVIFFDVLFVSLHDHVSKHRNDSEA